MANDVRLVVLGDSIFDPGHKRQTVTGMIASATKQMRTNQIRRFTDTATAPDMIWELTGGEPLVQQNREVTNELTSAHMSLANSTNGSPNNKVSYVNYATGGAVAQRSSQFANKVGLTTIGAQKDQYFKELDEETRNYGEKPKIALHTILIGLNDTVTDGKGPDQMPQLIDNIDRMTREIRDRLAEDGTEAQFLLINNPSPEQAVRFANNPDDPTVRKAQAATERFNKLLEDRFAGVPNMAISDISQIFNPDALHQFNILKASQNRGEPVEYEPPYNPDISLANALADFRDNHQNTTKGKNIYSEIKTFYDEALETDNDILLHRKVASIVLRRMKEGDNSAEINALKDALLATGTFANKLDFATNYYQRMHDSEKHSGDIGKIRAEIHKIYSKYENNPNKQLSDDLNYLNHDLYEAVEKSLGNSSPKSTYRELMQKVVRNDFGFAATSDQVHPTTDLNTVLALQIASDINKNFPDTLGPTFRENTKQLYANRRYSSENPLNHLEEEIPHHEHTTHRDMQRFTQPTIDKTNPNTNQKVRFNDTVEKIEKNGERIRSTRL